MAPLARVLLLDVREPQRGAIASLGERYGARVDSVSGDAPSETSELFQLCVVQVDGDGPSACDRVRALRKTAGAAPIVVLVGQLDVDSVVRLMRIGSADVVGLPGPSAQIAARVLAHLADPAPESSVSLVGRTPVIQRLRAEVAAIAATRSPVLLTGETGTGKSLVARLIHERSDRAADPFVRVDCGALSSDDLERELFGREPVAGRPHSGSPGRFERAAAGTLFLDEIGDLDGVLQAKILRVLQDREYEPIGGTRTRTSRARVVAATNQDLRRAIDEGRFRTDLYFRLKVLHLEVPPLAQRIDDIPLLVQAILERLAASMGYAVPMVSDGLVERLMAHSWPGNVRELTNVIERLLVRHGGRALEAGDLDGVLESEDRSQRAALLRTPAAAAGGDLPERDRVATALAETGGNIARAARRLRMPRSTLRYRIQRLGLEELIPTD
jgi:DNA-binding NtrC family response regulator